MKTLNCIGVVLVGACLLSAFGAAANDTPTPTALKQALGRVAAPELPAKVAALVAQAKVADREATTVAAVTFAVKQKPAAAPAIVGAIAKAVPEMASVAAATAAKLQPKLASAIVRAAVAGAPDQASQVLVAVQRQAATSGASPLLDAPGAETARGPSIGPPYTPPTGTPVNTSTNSSGPVPPGGRNYAQP